MCVCCSEQMCVMLAVCVTVTRCVKLVVFGEVGICDAGCVRCNGQVCVCV